MSSCGKGWGPKWLFLVTLPVPRQVSPRSLERVGFKTSHLDSIPGKKVTTGGSRSDSPEIC